MRSYPLNSSQAAARILALSMLADGHVSRDELRVLDEPGVHGNLGLDDETWQQVLLELCEDLQGGHRLAWAQACQVDARTLDQVLDEVSDPALRRRLLALCRDVVEADGQVTEDEWGVLSAAVNRWCLHYEVVSGQLGDATVGDQALALAPTR
jgi:hypothetical protein